MGSDSVPMQIMGSDSTIMGIVLVLSGIVVIVALHQFLLLAWYQYNDNEE